jgi:cell cycle checkpoint protein
VEASRAEWRSFIPLALTFITRALKRVLSLAIGPNDQPPNSAVQLVALSCNGDLRSAINSLQMLCTYGRDRGASKKRKFGQDAGGTNGKKSGKGSKGGRGAKLNVSEELRSM